MFYGDLNIPLPSPGLHPGEPAAVVLLPGEAGTVGAGAQSVLAAGAAQITDNTNTHHHSYTHFNSFHLEK